MKGNTSHRNLAYELIPRKGSCAILKHEFSKRGNQFLPSVVSRTIQCELSSPREMPLRRSSVLPFALKQKIE